MIQRHCRVKSHKGLFARRECDADLWKTIGYILGADLLAKPPTQRFSLARACCDSTSSWSCTGAVSLSLSRGLAAAHDQL